jgi:hypothetical protein
MLLLQDKVYEGYACNAITGTVSRAALAEIRHAVRSRVLELMIEFERAVPEAAMILIGEKNSGSLTSSAAASQISQQIIYGNVTSISATGERAQVTISINKGDTQGFIECLTQAGINETDAREFATVVAGEEPESKQEPLGARARNWLIQNIKKAADGTWRVGVSVATDVIKEAALKYYGLK